MFQQSSFQVNSFQLGAPEAAPVYWPFQSDAFQFYGSASSAPTGFDLTDGLLVPDPRSLPWASWAGAVTVNFSRYNLPNSVDESLWQVWATELFAIPGLVEQGLPDPRAFNSDWRGWGVALILAMQ